MRTSRVFFAAVILCALVALGAIVSRAYLGGSTAIDALVGPVGFSVPDDSNITMSATEGVVYVSARQICTERMGCTCKHRRSDTDTMKIHRPEDDPTDSQDSWTAHLDIKCTKCNRRWYCPKTNSFRN